MQKTKQELINYVRQYEQNLRNITMELDKLNEQLRAKEAEDLKLRQTISENEKTVSTLKIEIQKKKLDQVRMKAELERTRAEATQVTQHSRTTF